MKRFITPKTFISIISVMAALAARADYSNTVKSFNPVGYWRVDETNQPPPPDQATNTGTLGAAANGYYAAGASHGQTTGALVGSGDTAATFDGSSGQVTVPYIAPF